MSRLKVVVLALVSFILILLLALFLIVILVPDCHGPEYLVNDFGGCELVD